MGKNSVFDQIGIGASDLGLAKDPKKVANDNYKKLKAQEAEAAATKKQADDAAAAEENKQRMAATTSRASTLLTGSQGLQDDENQSIARRTLMGT